MTASSTEGVGHGSASDVLRGRDLDNLSKVLIGQVNALKTCIEIVDGKPTLRVGAGDVPFDDTGLSFSADTVQEAIAALDVSVGSVSCIEDSDADTFVCVSGSNDVTVALGDDGSYADNPSLLILNHSGCTFTGSDGTSLPTPGTGWNFTAGDGFGVGGIGTGQGGGFNFVTGSSGDGFSSGGSLNITGANNNPSGGTAGLFSGSSTTGIGTGVAGGVVLEAGGSDGTAGSVNINAGTNTLIGDGGAINNATGSSFGIVGGGGDYTVGAGSTFALLGDGGDIVLNAGHVFFPANPGDGGNVTLTGGTTSGPGTGGDITLNPGSGTTDGAIYIGNTATVPGDLRFLEFGGANYIGFKAPAAITTDVVWELPDAEGTDLQHLTTDGAGVLRWSNNRATTTFDNTNLVANVFTFTHNLGEQYLSSVMVYDGSGLLQTLGNSGFPTDVVDANTVTVDFGGAIVGTYTIVAKV